MKTEYKVYIKRSIKHQMIPSEVESKIRHIEGIMRNKKWWEKVFFAFWAEKEFLIRLKQQRKDYECGLYYYSVIREKLDDGVRDLKFMLNLGTDNEEKAIEIYDRQVHIIKERIKLERTCGVIKDFTEVV